MLKSNMSRVARKISGKGACICGISQSLTVRVRAPSVAFAVIAFALHVLVLLTAVHGASGASCAAVTAGGPRDFKILLQINAWNKVGAVGALRILILIFHHWHFWILPSFLLSPFCLVFRQQ